MDQMRQTTNKGFFDLEAIKAGLSLRAEHWVPRHFQSGQRQGAEWRLGNIQGQAAKIKGKIGSCAIRLIGDQAGSFYDFATDEQGGPLQTLGHATGLQGKQLFAYAAELVGHLPTETGFSGGSNLPTRERRNQGASVGTTKSQNRIDGDKRRLIEKIWMECIPCGGNIAEAYLSSRGLQVPSSSDLLFHPNLMDYSSQKSFPALVAGIRDAENELIGIHRTYLHDVDGQWRVHSRKMLGRTKGGWVCLNDPDPAQSSADTGGSGLREVIVGEGIETVLSVATVCPQARLYACLSAGGLKAALMPLDVSHILILADNDRNDVGIKAAKSAANRWKHNNGSKAGLQIQIAMPSGVGQDFNDVLRQQGLKGIQLALTSDLTQSLDAAEKAARGLAEQAIDDQIEISSQADAADQFCANFANKLRYSPHYGKWFIWNDQRWQQDDLDFAFHLSAHFSHGLKGIKNWERGKANFISSVLRIARTEPEIAVRAGHWNADPWLLGTPSGTVELRSGRLQAARPTDYMSKQTSIGPVVGSAPKLWLRFLSDATRGDQELIDYLQRICGYLLTGVTAEHALFFVYGSGGNGKSVFLNTVTNILGDYARTAAMETFTASSGDRHPTELAMLEGARLVSVSETEEGRSWAESRIKQLTGGDKVSARFMRQDFFEYTPQFKLLIVGNHKPILRNVDEASKRRFNIIPFVHKPATPDKDLEDKLRAEYPMILAWMVEGCLAWQREGLKKPEVVLQATEAYFDDQDLMAIWLSECCTLGSQEWEKTGSLFANWKAFAERNGERPGSAKSFSSSLLKRGFEPARRRFDGSVHRTFKGLSIRFERDAASEAFDR